MIVKLVKDKISFDDVERLAKDTFGDMVKVVVDIDKKIITLGGHLHADGEKLLLENGSKQENLWGINIYPNKEKDKWIEYHSLINIRPAQGNRSSIIQDETIKRKIQNIIHSLIPK